jgi:hypothetical protein
VSEDPERLVAEALRAHAARTPLPARATEPAEDTGPVLGGYGLLSGSGVDMPPRRPEPTVREPGRTENTNRIEPDQGIAVGWVLLLAVLLGLAAGAVVGLVTLL